MEEHNRSYKKEKKKKYIYIYIKKCKYNKQIQDKRI